VNGDAHQSAWGVANFTSLPFWLAMIVAPRSRFTAKMMDRVLPVHAGLAIAYTAFLSRAMVTGEERVDFTRLDSVSKAFQNPDAMLAGWIHYITFDLFVGSWIWRRSLAEGRNARLALLLTWWAGPAGLGLFLARRRLPAWVP
jgi:hypothetical protein